MKIDRFWKNAGLSDFMIKRSHLETPHSGGIPLEEAGRGISPTQGPIPDVIHDSKEKDIHASSEIRTRNPSKRATADPRLRPRGHQDRQQYTVTDI
jgi:hypothetical protein